MLNISSKTFNPDILYIFDPWNGGGSKSKEHAHDFLELSILLEGEALYTIAGKQYHLHSGTVLLFNPNTIHGQFQPEDTYSHQLHIGITNLSLEGLEPNVFPNKSAILNLGELFSPFFDRAWQLVNEVHEERSQYLLMIKGLVTEMLVMILRNLDEHRENTVEVQLSSNDRRKQDLVNHAVYYLETHHEEDITLDSLAETLLVSPTYLSKTFKERMGVSPINYLIQIRLNRAKELLKDKDLTVKEVAHSVGYDDAYYFSKLFKKYNGKAPSQID